MADAKLSATQARPLSPHLQVYRPMLTMTMSIVHRITGAALFFGTLLLAWWLVAVAMGPEAYGTFMALADGIIGRIVLFGFTWALVHHMLGGLRHFIWDAGKGFNLALVEVLAWGTIIGSIAITLVIWVIAYGMMGGQ